MSTDTTPQSEVVIACDMNAVTPEQQERWVGEIVPRLYKAVQEIQELPDGYAFRLPNDAEILLLVAEDLNMERLCCPFLRYTLEIEPNKGPFWLRFTGPEGVKEFLRIGFEAASLFDEHVAKAAGFNVSIATDIDSVEIARESVDKLNERYASTANSSDN